MSLLSRILGHPADKTSNADSVTYDDVGVTRHHASGRVDDVDWADLREVAVMVRAPGDVHIVLTGQRASTIVNPRTPGVALLAQRLAKLTGYDQEAFTRAIDATGRGRVVCWQRGSASGIEVAAPAPVPLAVPPTAPAPFDFQLVPIDAEQAPAAVPRPTRAALCLDTAPSRATATDLAREAMRDMARVYKIEMDGSIDSLVHIDRAIAELHAAGAAWESVSKSLFAMGSYAGAVLVRRTRGRWVDAADGGADNGNLDDAFLAVELPDGARWSPIAICVEALLDGPAHSLLRTARALQGAQRAAQGNV